MLNTLRSNVLSCYRGICCLVFLLCSLFNLSNVLAEGSKDLYPVGASGNRAFLYSNAALGIISTSVAFPFRTLGTHYVYAVKNEYIAVASSAQGVGNGIIIITSPSGVQTMTTVGSTVGKISSRTEELAGPRFPGEGAGNNRYLPYSFQVGNDEGVWKIEFIPTGNKVDTNSPTASDVFADGTWSQSNNTPLISAWDVSVCNAVKDKWLRGRVYTNVLNLKLSQNFDDSNKAYNGINYVLTKDGRAYRVKNNGNNGLGFTFFSNNKGFVDATGNPLYKSLNTTDETVIANAVHDPRAVDDLTKNLVTHKLFYGPPSPDLPVSAKVAIDGTTSTTTWLKNEPTVPVVSNIDFVGSEGTVGQASQKGGTIIFKTNVAGSYRITIPLGAGKDRVLNGAAANGVNTIKWDGKDGLGNLVPGGLVVPEVRVRLASAEVHFPFIDMEINPKGIIIELTENSAFYPVNPTPNIIDESVYSDRVYWDDSDITGGKAGEVSNPQVNVINGISSNSNGHKWGSYSGSSGSGNSGTGTNSYGNEKAMDTYAYILSKEEAQPLNVNVKVADLQVVSVIPTYTSTAAGTQVTYAVKVKNAGVSDVTGAAFHFNVPTGFTVNANGIISSFTGATGAESNAVLDATGFSSMLDLANGCIVTYTINGTIGAGISGNDILVDASIMRPKDVTDPDATNIIFDKAPTNPHDECLNGTANEVCNNIKYNTAHAQLVCVNSSIVPIEYVLEAGGTDVQILPELPAGLVKNITGGKLTITGTPTASGVFTFTINTLGTQRSTKTVVLTVGSRAIASDIEVADKAICIGQSAELTSNLAAGSTIVNPVFNWYSEAALTTLLHTGTIYTVNPTVSTTYYVTVKGDNSCENASGAGKAVTITVNPLPLQPTVTASGGTTFCVGGSVVLTSNAATSYQWYRGTTLLTGETNQTYTASESGNYTVIVTDGNSCSSPASAAVPVTVNPLPLQPTVTASAGTTFCLGGSVVLTSSAATSYQWYRGTTLLTGETNQTYTASESGNYTVIITDGNSCSSPASTAVTVTVNPLPLQPTVTASAGTTFCLGGSVTLTSSVAASYQWYRGTTLLTGETNQTYTASESGNYTVIVTDGNSCSSPASTAVTVTVNPLPLQPTVTASAGTTFCLGGSVTLTSSAAASYQWYRGTTLLTGETNQTYRATVTGNYTVVVTDGNSCSSPASAAVTVTVNPLPLQPTVTASAGTTFCLGGSVTLTSSAAASYQWYRGTTLLTGETNQTYRATVTGNYTVVVTDGNSCSSPASAAVPVTVNPLPLQPTVTASGGTTFCLGGSVTLTSSAAASYQWYRGTTLLTGETNQTYTASESGNYTVIVTDGNSCSSPASTAVTVTVNPLPLQPTVTASAGTTFCLGGSVTLTSSAAASYQWYRGTTLLTGETNQTYTASESGNYTVVVTDGNSCSSPASAAVPVTVNPLPLQPTVTASAGTTFCLGGSVTLTSSAAASYQWYRGTTLLTGETNQTYTASESGNYTVIVTDGNSCSSPASAAVPVTVNPLPLQPTVTASGGTTFCVGGSVVLTSSAATSYQWYRGTTLLTGETNQTYTASESGNYTVVVTDGNSCSSPASTAVPVTVNPLPLQPTVTASAGTTFCLGGSVTLTSSVAASYQWYRGTTLLTGETNQTYTASESGNYTVIVTDGNSCSSPASTAVPVTVNPLPLQPTVTAFTGTTFCLGGSVTLTSSVAASYQWYRGTTLLTGETNQTYTASESGNYTVIVTDGNSCSSPASTAVPVTVNPLPLQPTVTAFTGTTFCLGGSVTLTSSAAASYQWYRGTTLLTGETNQTYTASESGNYTVIVTDGNSCSSPASTAVPVTVNPLPLQPTVNASGGTTFCLGGSVTLTSSAAASYQWYRGTTLLTGETNQTYRATVTGNYTVVVTDGNSCSSPALAAVPVTVNPLPLQPTVTASGGTTFCLGGSVTLTSSAAASYQWYRGTTLLTGETNQTYTASESGNYTVIVTDGNSCSSPALAAVPVTVNPLPLQPTVTASGGTTFCVGGSVVLTSSAATSYQWYRGTTLLTGETNQTYRATVTGNYTVVVTDGNSCSSPASAAVPVTVNPLPLQPTVIAESNTIFCIGGSVKLTSSASTGNQWYKDGNLISGAVNKTYIATATGSYFTIVTNANGCSSLPSQAIPVTVSPYPEIPDISPAGATTFCEGGIVTLTSSSANGNQWYKNGVLMPGATGKTLDVNQIGDYTVKVTNSTGCASNLSALTKVTVNRVPKGFDDNINSLSCSQSSFSYNLQTKNVNNTLKGGNGVAASFTWTVNSTVLGAINGSGKILNATLINTSTTEQTVVYIVTPIAETGGCAGQPFKITVRVPACIDISISKTADKNVVATVGDKINYTITIKNTGDANHNNVKVNDPLLGGMLSQPTGDNGNAILEKDETWTYRGTYTVTQNDLDLNGIPTGNTGKIINTATVSSQAYPQSKSAIAEVDIHTNPSITLVKTGAMNRDFKTMTYTFNITNNGNVTLNNLVVRDPKIPQLIALKQTILAPGASTTGIAVYTITNEEKIAGTVSNTATVAGFTKTNVKVTDVSGTAENNDEPTVIDITRYPIAIDDYAKTKAEEEVAVPVINNDRPALFPLNAATLEVKSQPVNGKLLVNKDGKVVYKPNKGFFGIEKFTYKVDDANGLSSNVAIVTINVAPPDLDIPNTFTPNGDGKNDTFLITGLENYDGVSLFVYNRWGDEVYKNNNYKNEWDGNGLNDGTYFYVLKLRTGNKEESKRSWVLIKR